MKTKAQIEYQIWKRHRLDRRYHWLHKYKCAKGCEICKWKPSERYIKLHNGISMGYTFVFDHIDQETNIYHQLEGWGGKECLHLQKEL